MPSEDPDKQSKIVGKYLRYSYLGMQLFVSVGLCTYGGLWLDRKVDVLPLFTLLGLALGFSAGFYSVYKDLFPSRSRPQASSGGGEGDQRGETQNADDTTSRRAERRPD